MNRVSHYYKSSFDFPLKTTVKSECSLFRDTSCLIGEKKCLSLFLSMPYVPWPVNHQRSGTQKNRIPLSGSRSESETVTTRRTKKHGSPQELTQENGSQIAGHRVLLVHPPGLHTAPSGLLHRVNLGAGTPSMKDTLLSYISPTTLHHFPPSRKGSTAFLMTQHILPLILRKTGINCSQNHSSYAKCIPWLLLNCS